MELTDIVQKLLKECNDIKQTKKDFELDPSVNNINVRSRIKNIKGRKAYDENPGTAKTILMANEIRNYETLEQHINKDNFSDFKKLVYSKLDEDKKAVVYMDLLEDNEDIRINMQIDAIKRVAEKYKLEKKLIQENKDFAKLSDDEKLNEYQEAISKDESMQEDFLKDPATQVKLGLDLTYNINSLLRKNKVEDAVDLVNGILNSDINSLLAGHYMDAGKEAMAKIVVKQVLNAQRKKILNLIKENKHLEKDTDEAIARTDYGYAKAAAKIYKAASE